MKSANLVMDLIQYPVLYQLTIHPQSNVKLVNVLVFLCNNQKWLVELFSFLQFCPIILVFEKLGPGLRQLSRKFKARSALSWELLAPASPTNLIVIICSEALIDPRPDSTKDFLYSSLYLCCSFHRSTSSGPSSFRTEKSLGANSKRPKYSSETSATISTTSRPRPMRSLRGVRTFCR